MSREIDALRLLSELQKLETREEMIDYIKTYVDRISKEDAWGADEGKERARAHIGEGCGHV